MTWNTTGTATLAGRSVRIASNGGETFARTRTGWRVVADWELADVSWA